MSRLLLLLCLCTINLVCFAGQNQAVAIFAGGCFCCMQAPFAKLPGVKRTVVGYTGGDSKNPSYQDVSAGGTGHREAVAVYYNPQSISYAKLVDVFWHNIDPIDNGGQFCDRGNTYKAVIFYLNPTQEKLAKAGKAALVRTKRFPMVVTKILPATKFYPAETYHQSYYKKNPTRYRFYRFSCGRDRRLNALWK